MNAMPSLNGSVGYIFTSCELDVKNSGTVAFKDVIERFKVYDKPRRPEGRAEEWLGGERVDVRGLLVDLFQWYDFSNVDIQGLEYLLYGRLYLPTGRLEALYSTRISPTLQALVAGISDPRSNVNVDRRSRVDNVSNVMVNLQHDIGKWCTEYTWSAEDAMWGVRVLHNFGRVGPSIDGSFEDSLQADGKPTRLKRVDEEDAVSGGLKGRVSVGAEAYFSAKEKSAGGKQHVRGRSTRFSVFRSQCPPVYALPPFQMPHRHHFSSLEIPHLLCPMDHMAEAFLHLPPPLQPCLTQCLDICLVHTQPEFLAISHYVPDLISTSIAMKVNGLWVLNGG